MIERYMPPRLASPAASNFSIALGRSNRSVVPSTNMAASAKRRSHRVKVMYLCRNSRLAFSSVLKPVRRSLTLVRRIADPFSRGVTKKYRIASKDASFAICEEWVVATNCTGHALPSLYFFSNIVRISLSFLINTACIWGCKWASGSSINIRWTPDSGWRVVNSRKKSKQFEQDKNQIPGAETVVDLGQIDAIWNRTHITDRSCTAPGFLDTRLRYAAWRSSYSSRASSGVRYASFSRRQHWL